MQDIQKIYLSMLNAQHSLTVCHEVEVPNWKEIFCNIISTETNFTVIVPCGVKDVK